MVCISAARTVSQARRAVLALFCVIAFALQGYIAQTHIHAAGSPGLALAGAASSTANQIQQGDPDGKQDDLSKCPYCQVSASVGNALWAAPLTILVFLSSRLIEPVAAEFIIRDAAPAHVWRSRGPPIR